MLELCEVEYRYISMQDQMTPLMYLPIQRTILHVESPCGTEQTRVAIMNAYGREWKWRPELISDIKAFPVKKEN